MSVYTDFQKFVNDMEASDRFKQWCNLHAADCTAWKTYRTGLLTDTPSPSPPSLSTSFGKALVDVGVMAVAAGLVAPPPPSPLTAAFMFSSAGLVVTVTDQSVAGPGGAITGWHWDFGDGNTSNVQNPPPHTYASAGTKTITLTVTSPDGTDQVSHSVNVAAPAAGFFAASNFPRPTFTPVRTVRFWQKSGADSLDAAIAGMQPGDLIKYDPTFFGKPSQPLTISSSTTRPYTIHDKNPSSPVVIDFGCSHNLWDPSKVTNEYVRFAYTGTQSGWEGLLLYNVSNLRIYGGEYDTGHYGGAAFRTFAPVRNCLVLGAYVAMAGGSGVGIAGKTVSGGLGVGNSGNRFQFEVNRFSMNPAQDPHPDKGTGQHGMILHGGGFYTDNDFAIYAHDPLRPGEISAGKTWPEGAGGGAVEVGIDENLNYADNHYWVLAENMLMETNGSNPGSTSSQHIGGWAILAYGHGVMTDNVFEWAEARHMSSGVINCGGGTWWQTPAGHEISMLVGRRTDVRRYPAGIQAPNNVEYPTGFRIDYVDCT